MFMRSDLSQIGIGAGAAATAGLIVGAWLSLPAEAPERAGADEQAIATVDPNLAAYRAMLAAEGVSPQPYVVASAASPWLPSAPPESAEIGRDETADWQAPDGPADQPYETAYAEAGEPAEIEAEEPAAAMAAAVPQPQEAAPQAVAPFHDEAGEPRELAYGPSPSWAPHHTLEAWPSWR